MKVVGWVALSAALLGCVACGGAGEGSSPEVEVSEGDPSGQSEALTVNALSPAQQKVALKLIDDICGDTWCEGDYNFGFRRLVCSRSAHTCTLTMQIFPESAEPGQPKSYWRSCKTPHFHGFSSLVSSASNGYQSLESEYYDALSECVARIEGNLR